MTTMNATSNGGFKKFAPALYLLLGAVLGGGGVYTLQLARAPAQVHVGAPRPDGLAMTRPDAAALTAPAQSPAPLSDLTAQNAAEPATARPAAPAPGAAPQAPRPAGDRRLVASTLGVSGGARSGAFQSSAAGASASSLKAKAAPKPFAAPKLVTRTAAASGSIRYGVASRSELMGPGAGPVYNLKGNAPAAQGNVNSLIQQVGTMVQGAEAQMDATQMPESDRKQIDQTLQTAAAATGQ